MQPGEKRSANALLRLLPSVDEMLQTRAAADGLGRRQITSLVRLAINDIRGLAATLDPKTSREEIRDLIDAALAAYIDSARRSALTQVVNATGVIIHTNLGRAPLSAEASAAMRGAARYCSLEYDIQAGTRGLRSPFVEHLICDLTGAEASLVVNNCAAAAFLVLKALADRSEVIVSRGQLIEIGGDFRIPDILAQSGAIMCEVGTTNRTTLGDFEEAISDSSSLILRVHPSNFRVIGFTAQPSLVELSTLARSRGLILYENIGGGSLIDLEPLGISDEPRVQDSLTAGVDIITFSGDKLLGGPQCGIIAGRSDVIARLRKHPLMRALRVDKTIAAALEATLIPYTNEREMSEVPVLKMLLMSYAEIKERAEKLVERFDKRSPVRLAIIDGMSVVGGGAAPGAELRTSLISVTHRQYTSSEIETKLRTFDTPVIARIDDDRVLLDLRTVAVEDEAILTAALNSI